MRQRDMYRIRIAHGVNDILERFPFKGSPVLARMVSRLLVPRARGAVTILTRYGFRITLNPVEDRGLERSIYYRGHYEAGTLDIMEKLLRPGDRFLDVGANIGFMTLLAARCVGPRGTVMAFEPEPHAHRILLENLGLNDAGNVRVFDIALGSREETATIYSRMGVSRGSATLVPPPEGASDTAEVRVRTLDSVLEEASVTGARMIKIDVEGLELEVLKGAQQLLEGPDAPAICVECSEVHSMKGGRTEDLFRLIRELNGYRVYRLKHHKERPSPLLEIPDASALPRHDNIFGFLPRHREELPRSMFG